jgi:adhesin/invasin
MIGKPCWGILASTAAALALLTGCSSTPATVAPAAVTTVTANSPFAQNATLNANFAAPFSVTVTTNGTPVSGAVVTFFAPGAGAGGTFANGTNSTTATTDANGVAVSSTFTTDTPPALANPFTANGTVGTYNVIASVASTTSTALFSLANTLVPAPITVAGGSPQSTTISTQFANLLAVTVNDASGKAVGAGLPVTFTAPDGTFADTEVSTTTALTNASGVATSAAYVASDVIGTYSVTASTASDPATATFSLSNTIMPATITANTGTTPQSAAKGTDFATALSVTVMDGSTPPNPVPNAVVTFTAPAFTVDSTTLVPSAASGTFADSTTVTTTAWTDGTGVATAAAFTANDLAGGPYDVTATVVVKSGTTLTATFSLTNQ